MGTMKIKTYILYKAENRFLARNFVIFTLRSASFSETYKVQMAGELADSPLDSQI